MSAFFLLALLLAAVTITVRSGEGVLDTLPFATGCGILLLYLLAFFGALPLAGWISCAVLAGGCLFLLIRKRTGRNTFAWCRDPQLWLVMGLLVSAAALTAGRVVVWWDDLNFWANDAKFLWYMGGFAGKYGNVSPEFGDYPPAQALWKWVFLSLSPHTYREGLQYSAYHVLNMIFLLPLIAVTGRMCRPAVRMLTPPVVFLLPGAVCGLQYTGAAADITMGCVFGTMLIDMTEIRRLEKESPGGPGTLFRYARVAVCGAVLVLLKSVGFLWALIALFYWFFVCGGDHLRTKLFTAILPVITLGSWGSFCLINRRVAKLTGEGLRMARNGLPIPENAGERMRIFAEAFFRWPMHEDKNPLLDFSTGAWLGVLIISIVILMASERFQNGKGKMFYGRMLLWLTASCGIVYGGILLAHFTVFQTEDQYLQPYNMSLSLSRYGAPLTLGTAMLLLFLAIRIGTDGKRRRAERMAAILTFLLLPVLAADYAGELRAFVTWRVTAAADRQIREVTIDPEGRRFLQAMAEREDLHGKRVLFLRNTAAEHRVKDTYISYEACPVAVVYGDADPAMDDAAIDAARETAHATEVYIDAWH